MPFLHQQLRGLLLRPKLASSSNNRRTLPGRRRAFKSRNACFTVELIFLRLQRSPHPLLWGVGFSASPCASRDVPKISERRAAVSTENETESGVNTPDSSARGGKGTAKQARERQLTIVSSTVGEFKLRNFAGIFHAEQTACFRCRNAGNCAAARHP